MHQVEKELTEYCTRNLCETDVHRDYAYDGIWALALALNRTLYASGRHPDLSKLASGLSAQLLSSVKNISFEGLTGKVRFENNERLGLVFIYQWFNGSYLTIGSHDSANNVFTVHPVTGTANSLRRNGTLKCPFQIGLLHWIRPLLSGNDSTSATTYLERCACFLCLESC